VWPILVVSTTGYSGSGDNSTSTTSYDHSRGVKSGSESATTAGNSAGTGTDTTTAASANANTNTNTDDDNKDKDEQLVAQLGIRNPLTLTGGGLLNSNGQPANTSGDPDAPSAPTLAERVTKVLSDAVDTAKQVVSDGVDRVKEAFNGVFSSAVPAPAAGEDGKRQGDKPSLIDSKGEAHILDGDATGGGHRPGTGEPGKSEFPSGWSDDRIKGEISDVATDPDSTRTPGRDGRTVVKGTRDGVDIRVIIDRNGRIVTGFPTNQPRNPK
jgi:Bacterial EndoU nuclease